MTFTELDIIAIVQHLDADNDGTIDMVEFVRAIEQSMALWNPSWSRRKPSLTDAKVDDVQALERRRLAPDSRIVCFVARPCVGERLIGPVNGEGGTSNST